MMEPSNPDVQALDDLSQRRLLRDMEQGDRAAFDRFVAIHTPALWRFAQTRLSRNPELVADIVQNTLVAAVEQLDAFRGEGPLGAWVISICRNQIATHWRRSQVRERWAAEGEVDFDGIESTDESPSDALEDKEKRATVHSTLELLPPPYGAVLEWKYLEEISVKEIATRLEMSPKAAESTLTRARVAFRRLLEMSPLCWGAS